MRIGPLGRRADGTMGAVVGAARSNRGDGGIEGLLPNLGFAS
jgi:hypothetical protein